MKKTDREFYKEELNQLLIIGVVVSSEKNDFINYLKNNYRRKKFNYYEPNYKNFLEFPEPYDTFTEVYTDWNYNR